MLRRYYYHHLMQTTPTPQPIWQLDLTKKSNGWYPIHAAAANGNLGVIKQLLKVCPDCMWARDASGQSFLHVAVREWSLNVVDYVCTEKTLFQILNMTDHDGNTALHLAVKSGNQRSFCSLMNNMRLCLSISNKKGRTPRDVASFNLAHGLSSFMVRILACILPTGLSIFIQYCTPLSKEQTICFLDDALGFENIDISSLETGSS